MVEQLQGQAQGLALGDFLDVVDMGFYGVERLAALVAVGLVDAHRAKKRVRVVAKHQQVARLAHVAVVVHPFGQHGGAVHAQGCGNRRAWVPRWRGRAFERGAQAVGFFEGGVRGGHGYKNGSNVRVGPAARFFRQSLSRQRPPGPRQCRAAQRSGPPPAQSRRARCSPPNCQKCGRPEKCNPPA